MTVDLHIGTYNHLKGGIDLDSAGGKVLDRLGAQLDLLAPLSLDVLISTEANGWLDEEDDRALELARARLGMVPYGARAPRGFDVVVWLRPERLRDPREHHETGHPWWHAQARVSAQVDGLSDRLWLFGAHFAPFVPGIRLDEAYATAALADRLVIGGGDFNDDALFDPIPDRRAMSAGWRLRHARPGGESAAGILNAAEFGDIAALLHGGVGERVPTAGFKDGAPIRCDRIYVGKRLHETPRQLNTLPYDAQLSDHCAVHAWLDLSVAL